MTKSLQQCLASTKSPLFVSIPKGETGENLVLASFKDTNTGILLDTNNSYQPFSPFSKEPLAKLSSVSWSIDSTAIASMVKIGSCESCSTDQYTTSEVASSISSNEPFFCTLCSEEVDLDIQETETPDEDHDLMYDSDDSDESDEEIEESTYSGENCDSETSDDNTIKVESSLLDFANGYEMAYIENDENAKWCLFMHNQPMAITEYKHCPNNLKNIFKDQTIFKQAFKMAVDKNGYSPKILNEFGFKPFCVKLTDNQLKDYVNTALEQERNNLSTEKDQISTKLFSSFEIAFSGITKDFYEDSPNAIKCALMKILKACGIENVEALVNKAFHLSQKDFVSLLLAKTKELFEKPDTVRYEHAKLIEQASSKVVSMTQFDSRPFEIASTQKESEKRQNNQKGIYN